MKTTDHCKQIAFLVLASLTSILLNPCAAQYYQPNRYSGGNGFHFGTGGGFQFHANINNDTIREWMKSGKLKFQDSVLKNDTERAEHYVKADFVDDPIQGVAPIFYAAAHGGTKMVELLVRNGASVTRQIDHRSLVYVAASHGQFGTANVLLELGGGTQEDLSKARVLYAENSKRQREQAREANALALAFLGALMTSSSNSSNSGGDLYHDRNGRVLSPVEISGKISSDIAGL